MQQHPGRWGVAFGPGAAIAATAAGAVLVAVVGWVGSTFEEPSIIQAPDVGAVDSDDGSAPDGSLDGMDPDRPDGVSDAPVGLADGELTELLEQERATFEERCAGSPTRPAPSRDPDDLLLDVDDVIDLGLGNGVRRTLEPDDLSRVALVSEGPRDRQLLEDLGARGGLEQRLLGITGRVELAYLQFGSVREACIFSELDFVFSPGLNTPELVEGITTGWVVDDGVSRHLHFQVGDRLYLFLSDMGVDANLLTELARRQVQQLDTI